MLDARPLLLALGSSALLLNACGSDDASSAGGQNAQTPPTEARALEAWLGGGAYKSWQCEPEPHESRAPSPHGYNRICSNDLVSAHATESADWPNGAAAVKELFASADARTPNGYAVYLKTKSDSAGGANWYWYERIDSTVTADGFGNAGTAKSICVACHVAAGGDAAHTPTPGGRDQVYTPVP